MIQAFLRHMAMIVGGAHLPLSVAWAGVVVDYTAKSLGGNLWRYDYTIDNPTPSLGFDEVTAQRVAV